MNKIESVIRFLEGKQPEPSPVVDKFALFPDPDEQEKIRDYSGKRLGEFLKDYPDIAAMAAYDTTFALGDKKKASELLAEVSSRHGPDRIKTSLYAVNALRMEDQAPEAELTAFSQFCAEIGLNFKELTAAEAAETMISNEISSAVELHVDRMTDVDRIF